MRANKLKYQSFLLVGAAAAAMSIFGPAKADPYTVVNAPPSPTAGYTTGGYMFNSGGGIIVQPTDGAGHFVSASNGFPVICESGCSGGTGGSVSGFAPNGTYASPMAVTSVTSEIGLPAGTVVVISNVGTNAAYVNLGTSAAVTATLSGIIVPGNSSVSLTVGANTFIAAITGASTTTLNIAGGAGLFTGFGGGGAAGTGGGGGTVTQGPQGINTSPWFVSPGTSTFPISGTVAVSGTSTVVLNSALTVTANQGVQGTNTSPWFVSPGTSTFPITGNLTGTSTVALGGTGTVVVAGASIPPLSGTSTVILNSAPLVNQGVQGTNTSPWFVSPGTSTFPVSGTVTALPSGTQTVVQSGPLIGTSTVVQVNGAVVAQGVQGTNTSPWFVSPGTSTFPVSGTVTSVPGAGTNTVVGTVTSIPGAGTGTSLAVINDSAVLVSGTATSAAVLTTFPITANAGYGEIAWDISVLGSAGNIITAQEQLNGTWYNVGTASAIGMFVSAVAGTAFRLNETTYIGGTTSADANLRWAPDAVVVRQDPANPWGPLTGTTTVAVGGTSIITGNLSGTSTVFVAGGTSTAIPGAGTGTVLVTGTATTFEGQVTSTAGTAATQVINVQGIGAGNLNTNHITCGTTATVLAAARATRQTITIVNLTANQVNIGGVTVTTTSGQVLPAIIGASITLPVNVAIDCIAGTATATVAFDETY